MIENVRAAEQGKYEECYKDPDYKMGLTRMADAKTQVRAILRSVPPRDRWSYLDVGCGRGEMVALADSFGCHPSRGVECLSKLCSDLIDLGEITSLPYGDAQWDVVTCFDVMEHLPPEDTELALSELARVTNRVALLSISNIRSTWGATAVELHVNRRPYEEWERIINVVFSGFSRQAVSETVISKTWCCWKL